MSQQERMTKLNFIFSDFNIDFRRVGGKKFNKLKVLSIGEIKALKNI